MEIRPILSALLRNRAGAILVALQIAITLAIVVNAVFLTQQRVSQIGRPTGIDDQNIFSFSVDRLREGLRLPRHGARGHGAAAPDAGHRRCRARCQQVPLSGSGSSIRFYSLPDKKGENSPANTFRTDEHGVNALGVKLSAGTTFDPTMVEHKDEEEPGWPPTAVISQGLAEALFPGEARCSARTSTTTRASPSGSSASSSTCTVRGWAGTRSTASC